MVDRLVFAAGMAGVAGVGAHRAGSDRVVVGARTLPDRTGQPGGIGGVRLSRRACRVASIIRAMLIGALQRLGPRQRAVIVLRYWMDLTEPETAASLSCSVGTVKSQASRGLAMLRHDTELVDEGFQ
jgi:hypothetical protein